MPNLHPPENLGRQIKAQIATLTVTLLVPGSAEGGPPWAFLSLVPEVSGDVQVEALYGRPPVKDRFRDLKSEVWQYHWPESRVREMAITFYLASRRVERVWARFDAPLHVEEVVGLLGRPRFQSGKSDEHPGHRTTWHYVSHDGQAELLLWVGSPDEGFSTLLLQRCRWSEDACRPRERF